MERSVSSKWHGHGSYPGNSECCSECLPLPFVTKSSGGKGVDAHWDPRHGVAHGMTTVLTVSDFGSKPAMLAT
jgi:hypothetical protein